MIQKLPHSYKKNSLSDTESKTVYTKIALLEFKLS